MARSAVKALGAHPLGPVCRAASLLQAPSSMGGIDRFTPRLRASSSTAAWSPRTSHRFPPISSHLPHSVLLYPPVEGPLPRPATTRSHSFLPEPPPPRVRHRGAFIPSTKPRPGASPVSRTLGRIQRVEGPSLPLAPLPLPITASSPQPRATAGWRLALCLGPLARPASSREPWISPKCPAFHRSEACPACPSALALGPPSPASARDRVVP